MSSSLSNQSSQSNPYPVKVIDWEENLVTVSSPITLVQGQVIDFKEGVSGVVLSEETVLLKESVRVTEGVVRTFMKVPAPVTKALVPLDALGTLRVKIVVSTNLEGSSLGWGFEGPEGLMIVGNDALTPSFASFEGTGFFAPGRYTLRVTRYIRPGLQALTTVERTWELSTPVGSLLAGDYHHDSPPILL